MSISISPRMVTVVVKTLREMFEVEYHTGAGVTGLKSSINALYPEYFEECQIIVPENFENVEDYSFFKAKNGDIFYMSIDTIDNCVTVQLPFELNYCIAGMSDVMSKMKTDYHIDRFCHMLDNGISPYHIRAKLYNVRWKSSYMGSHGLRSIIYHPSYGVTTDEFFKDTCETYDGENDTLVYWGIIDEKHDKKDIWFPTFRALLKSDMLKDKRMPFILSSDEFIDMIDAKISQISF